MANRTFSNNIVQPGLPGLARKDKVARPPKISEAALQQQVRRTLAFLGYGSFETGSTRAQVTCPGCAHCFFPTGWQGNSVGLPDLLIHALRDFPAVAALVELKTEGGKPSLAQQQLAESGRSVIAYSIAETIQAIIDAEEAMTAYQTPPDRLRRLKQFLIDNKGKI